MSYSQSRYEITKSPAHAGSAAMAARILEDESAAAPMDWVQAGTPRPDIQTAPQPDPSAIAAEWQRKVDEARAAGRREGEAAGRSQAAAEAKAVTERAARAVAELAAYRPNLRKQAESDVVRLAIAIARRVLRREIAADPDALRGLVVAALEKLQAQEITRVKAHPSQAAPIAACIQSAAPNLRVDILPEPSLEPGGLVFETNHGNLDASVESQLREIEKGLTDRLQRRG
jgi:flagellar assembly protein FliH